MLVSELIKKLEELKEQVMKYDSEPHVEIGFKKGYGTSFWDYKFELAENFSKETDIHIIIEDKD